MISERGFSLVETLVGTAILLVVTAGVLPLSVLALRISENHGHLAARSSEYAQDKLEQLMALSFGNTVSDTRTFPAADTGGSGLTPGGSVDLAAPVALYVDYLDRDGVLLDSPDGTPPVGWFYQRLWRIENEAGVAADAGNCPVSVSAAQICLKRITVIATVQQGAAGASRPSVTVAALKAFPF